MWPNNGFPHNGHLSNSLNQDEYASSSPYSSFSAQPYQGQPFAQHPNMTPFDESGDTFMNNGFQPDIRLYDGAFLQSQYSVPVPQFLSSSPPFNTPKTAAPTPRQPTQINARAKELKAQLLKGRENRAGTSTPPVATPAKNKSSETAENANHKNLSNPVNLNNSTNLGNSAKLGHSKSTEASPKVQASDEKEIDIEKLISEFSAPNETANASVKQDNGGTSAPASSLGSPPKSEILVSKRKPSGTSNSIKVGGRHASNGSEISEGEILESPRKTTPPKATRSPAAPKKVEAITNSNVGIPTRRGRPESPSRRSSFSKAQEPSRDDRRDDSDLRFEKRSQLDHRQERRQHAEPERHSYTRRDSRDHAEEYSRPDTNKSEQKEETRVVSRQSAPTLAQLLASDENLREWLEITGYHNAPYRDKILATRRKIKLLDQEREKLLAEMTMDERPGVQVPAAAMLPPPVPTRTPTKTEDRAETVSSEVQGNRNVSNKRPHSEIQEPREDSNTGKVARTEGRARIKAENDDRRPKSGDYDSSRRNSGDYREDREFRRERRERERERELSPSHRAFDSRPPARPKYEEDDRDDWPARREFVTRGGYRGRAYDPNYRGRGRGRGRGERDVREREDYGSNLGPFPREELRAAPYGATIASTKPFKDSRGFSQGGRGDTRYFIVKSFNEDNVLKCIEDSIWTTQVHVGEILKEAFLTCKNVILVFSINKSKAFQGYARMESLPGSVEMPLWQRVINWESAGAFRVRWLCICATRFHRIGHLKNSLNENQAVLIGKDGQEIEENCGSKLLELIDEEAMQLLGSSDWEHQNERNPGNSYWDD